MERGVPSFVPPCRCVELTLARVEGFVKLVYLSFVDVDAPAPVWLPCCGAMSTASLSPVKKQDKKGAKTAYGVVCNVEQLSTRWTLYFPSGRNHHCRETVRNLCKSNSWPQR